MVILVVHICKQYSLMSHVNAHEFTVFDERMMNHSATEKPVKKGFLQYIAGNLITAKTLTPAAGAANGEQFKDDDDNGTSKKCQFVIHGI